MDDQLFQKTVPSQETKTPWLHPSTVELVLHSLRVNAKTKPKVTRVISGSRLKKRIGLKESKPGEPTPNEYSHELGKKQDDVRPKGDLFKLDAARPNPACISPNSEFATNENEEDAYKIELKELEYRGRWALLLDKHERDENGMTEQDRTWFKIDELCGQGLLSYAVTSTSLYKEYPCTEELGCIWCFTADYRDEHDVRMRADVIRKALQLELTDKEILYVTNKAARSLSRRFTLSEASLYSQTDDYKFWKKGSDAAWCLVRKTKEVALTNTNSEFCKAIPSRVKVLPWIQPSVVEREKYSLRHKAKCTIIRTDTSEYTFDEDMSECSRISSDLTEPVESTTESKGSRETNGVDPKTTEINADHRSFQNDNNEVLVSLVEYLELEDSYVQTVHDDDSYVQIWTVFFNKVKHRDFRRHSEEKVKNAKEKEEEEEEIVEGNEDGKNENHKKNDEKENSNRDNEKEDYSGMWILLFDKTQKDAHTLTQLDRAWFKIDNLCELGFLQHAVVSTAVVNRYPCSKSVGCIRCYTEDYKDKEDVRRRGDVIREALEMELDQTVIYYVEEAQDDIRYTGLEETSIYRHTPDYCFWKEDYDVIGGWKLIPRIKGGKTTRIKFANREIVPSKVTYQSWIYDSLVDDEVDVFKRPSKNESNAAKLNKNQQDASNKQKSKQKSKKGKPKNAKPNDEPIKTESGLSNCETVTPQVKQKQICSSNLEEQPYSGKWMLFFDRIERDCNGHTQHDRAWFKIEDLCLKKQLGHAKASTAVDSDTDHNASLGSICCYTEDYRDQDDVRRKAHLIRRTLEDVLQSTSIYYKTDMATLNNEYTVLGFNKVSLYRQTADCSLWVRNPHDESWDLIFKGDRSYWRKYYNKP